MPKRRRTCPFRRRRNVLAWQKLQNTVKVRGSLIGTFSKRGKLFVTTCVCRLLPYAMPMSRSARASFRTCCSFRARVAGDEIRPLIWERKGAGCQIGIAYLKSVRCAHCNGWPSSQIGLSNNSSYPNPAHSLHLAAQDPDDGRLHEFSFCAIRRLLHYCCCALYISSGCLSGLLIY